MSTPSPQVGLQHYRILGIDRSPNTGIYMLNENAVVYFAGNNIVNHNLESKDQRFLPYTDTERGDVKCVAITANSTLLAYALEMDASIIHIIDIQSWVKKKSIVVPTGFSPTPFSALAFSTNGKYLIAQGTAESLLFYFDVQSGNLLCSQKITNNTNTSTAPTSSVTCISFHPNEPNSICCTGRGIFRQLTRNDKGFQIKQGSMTNKDTIDFKSHIWTFDGRTIIVSTSDGHIAQIDNSNIPVNITLANTTGGQVTHLTATQKGFACVTGGTKLHFFERSGEKNFVETNAIQIDEKETIAAVSIAQADDHVIVLMSDSRLISIPVTPGEQSQGDGMITLLPQHHIGPITGIDVAFRKQLLVSCGDDHAIRVWNYEKMQCEIAKFFSDQPLSVSFHPNGCAIIAGFAEKLRFMAITINDIVTHREFPIRGCKECKFSHGGQYFAAVNGNNVQVYSSYTFKNLVNLRSPGQRIKTVAWSTDDNVLVSCDANGTMTLHTVRTGKQKAASTQQAYHFTSIVCVDTVGTKCYGLTQPDNALRETEDMSTKNQLDVIAVPCQLVLGPNNKCLFVSTRNGTIRIYHFPGSAANGINFPSAENATEIIAHHAPVTSLVASPDNQYLFSSGEDGCIYMMKILSPETQAIRADARIQYSEDVLISRGELVEQLRALRRAQQDVADLEKEQKYKIDSLTQGFKQKRQELKQKFVEEQKSEIANVEELKKQIAAMNEDAEAQCSQIETQFKQMMQQKQARFEMKIMNEKEQEEQLKQETADSEQKMREEFERIIKENDNKVQEIKDDYERKLAEIDEQMVQVNEEKKQLKVEFNDWDVKINRELAFEIGKREFEALQQREKEAEKTASLLEKNKAIEVQLNNHKQNVEQGKEGLMKQQQTVNDLKEKIEKARQEKSQLSRELEERKESINEKQLHIEELTNLNQNLEKHRQLIRTRINGWKKQLEPMQAKKQDVAITHDRMRQELERYEKNDEQLRLEINELKLKIDAKRAEIEQRTKEFEDVKQITRQFKLEVHQVYQKLQEDENKEQKKRKGFAPALANLYRKYVGDEAAASQKKSKVTDIQVERNRERDALERNITAVARRISRGDEENNRQHGRMMEENVMLMTQISELRRQNANLVKRQRVIEESNKSAYTAEELNKILDMQIDRIQQLSEQLKQLQLRGNVSKRVPVSRERLPPMNAIEPPQ